MTGETDAPQRAPSAGAGAVAVTLQVAGDAGIALADGPVKRSRLGRRAKTSKHKHKDSEGDSARSYSSDQGRGTSKGRKWLPRTTEELPEETKHIPSKRSSLTAIGRADIETAGENASFTQNENQFIRPPSRNTKQKVNKKSSSMSSASRHGRECDGLNSRGSTPIKSVRSQQPTGYTTDVYRLPVYPMALESPANSPWHHSGYPPDYLQAYTHAVPAWSGYVQGTCPPPWSVCPPSPPGSPSVPGWTLQGPLYPSAGFPGFGPAPHVHPVPGLGSSEWYLQQFRMLTLQNQAAASVLYSMLPVIADLSKGDASKEKPPRDTSAASLLRLERETQSESLGPATASASTQLSHSLETKATQFSEEHLAREKSDPAPGKQDNLEQGIVSHTPVGVPKAVGKTLDDQSVVQQIEPQKKQQQGEDKGNSAVESPVRDSPKVEERRTEKELTQSPKQESAPSSPMAKRQHLELPPPPAPPRTAVTGAAAGSKFSLKRALPKGAQNHQKKFHHRSERSPSRRGNADKWRGANPKPLGYCINPPVFHGPGYPPAAPFVPQQLAQMHYSSTSTACNRFQMPQPQFQYHQQNSEGNCGKPGFFAGNTFSTRPHFPSQLSQATFAQASPPAASIELGTPHQQPQQQQQPQHNSWRRPFLTLQRAFKESAAAHKEEQQGPAQIAQHQMQRSQMNAQQHLQRPEMQRPQQPP